MSNSNDVNNALVGYNNLALPAEQNRELKARINLCKIIAHLMNDQEFNNLLNELVDAVFPILVRYNQWLLAESIAHLLSINKFTLEYKKWIMKEMICFVKDGQINAFYDFCNKNIPLSISARKVIEAQAMSQIRINEAEYYSHLRIDEERERSQFRLNEEVARSQNRINEYRQKKKADAEIKLWFRKEKHKQDLEFAADAKKRKEEESHTQTTMTLETVAVDYLELEKSFIKEKYLVRIMRDGEPKIW